VRQRLLVGSLVALGFGLALAATASASYVTDRPPPAIVTQADDMFVIPAFATLPPGLGTAFPLKDDTGTALTRATVVDRRESAQRAMEEWAVPAHRVLGSSPGQRSSADVSDQERTSGRRRLLSAFTSSVRGVLRI